MLKDKSSLVIHTPENDKQVILATTPLPTGKSEFQKFFTVSTSQIIMKNQSNVCIGCQVLSNCSLGQIKFQSKDNHFLAWLKQAWIFIESDSLGIDCPITISYLTKINPELTNLAFFHDHLANQLMLINVKEETTIALSPFTAPETSTTWHHDEWWWVRSNSSQFQTLQNVAQSWLQPFQSNDWCHWYQKCAEGRQAPWQILHLFCCWN